MSSASAPGGEPAAEPRPSSGDPLEPRFAGQRRPPTIGGLCHRGGNWPNNIEVGETISVDPDRAPGRHALQVRRSPKAQKCLLYPSQTATIIRLLGKLGPRPRLGQQVPEANQIFVSLTVTNTAPDINCGLSHCCYTLRVREGSRAAATTGGHSRQHHEPCSLCGQPRRQPLRNNSVRVDQGSCIE